MDLLVQLVTALALVFTPAPPAHDGCNAYRAVEHLPADVRRVAVLPDAGDPELRPVFLAELDRAKPFELIPVTPEQLRDWTSKTEWQTDEVLPADLLEKLQQATGCDAVLFCRRTRFSAYPPLAVGWKVMLVHCRNRLTLWAVDETFVADPPKNARLGLKALSPRQFGQSAAAKIVATLPPR